MLWYCTNVSTGGRTPWLSYAFHRISFFDCGGTTLIPQSSRQLKYQTIHRWHFLLWTLKFRIFDHDGLKSTSVRCYCKLFLQDFFCKERNREDICLISKIICCTFHIIRDNAASAAGKEPTSFGYASAEQI